MLGVCIEEQPADKKIASKRAPAIHRARLDCSSLIVDLRYEASPKHPDDHDY
jgi:hypothetical protein